MDTDLSQDCVIVVFMIKYLQKVLEKFPEIIKSIATTHAAEHLFQVRDEEDRKLLPEEQTQHFHNTVAQLLFCSSPQESGPKTNMTGRN